MLLLVSPVGRAVKKPPSNGSVTVTDVSGVLPPLVTVKVYLTVSTPRLVHPLVSITVELRAAAV